MLYLSPLLFPAQYMIVYGGLACFNRIQMVSLEKLGEDLGIDASSDTKLLVLCWRLGAEKPGCVSEAEWARLGTCPDLPTCDTPVTVETLKEIVATPPPAVPTPDAGGLTGERQHTPTAGGDDGGEADLLAAGLMSGVEAAGEGDLQRMATEAESGKSDVDFLRKQLVMALGDETFARAHARLQTVCEEEDDDVLVNDIQQILGAKRLDKLPMILKLIFLEGGGATIS